VYDVERQVPKRPEPPEGQRRRSSLGPVLLVVVPLAILILGVVAFTGRAGLLMLAVIASVPAFLMFHYLLWGHWLRKSLNRPDDE
jgi:hypothetical protein